MRAVRLDPLGEFEYASRISQEPGIEIEFHLTRNAELETRKFLKAGPQSLQSLRPPCSSHMIGRGRLRKNPVNTRRDIVHFLIWISTLGWGIVFGGLLLETAFIVPLWSGALPESLVTWNVNPYRSSHSGNVDCRRETSQSATEMAGHFLGLCAGSYCLHLHLFSS